MSRDTDELLREWRQGVISNHEDHERRLRVLEAQAVASKVWHGIFICCSGAIGTAITEFIVHLLTK